MSPGLLTLTTRRDNYDRRHDDSSESSGAGQLHQRRPDNDIHRRPDAPSKGISSYVRGLRRLLHDLRHVYI